jgi:hypothetical protein
MILHPPFEISARLLPSLHIGGAWVSLEYAGSTSDGRQRFRYYIDLPDGTEHVAAELKSGVGGCDLQEGFENLLAFLGAAAESYRYRGMQGENSDLFPESVNAWAALNSDEIDLARLDIEEATTRLIEEGRS